MRNIQTLNNATSFMPAWGTADQNLLKPRCETESTLHLSCEVVFGSPSADCMGTGICRITARSGSSSSPEERKRRCQSTVGLFFPIEGGKGVSLVLTQALLCTKLYKTHLRHGFLNLESPCRLPRNMAKTLGLKIRELPIGKYPILKNEGFLRIDFR